MQSASLFVLERPGGRDVRSLLDWADGLLSRRGFDETRLHAELLLGRALRLGRVQLTVQRDRALTAEEVDTFSQLVERRLTHEPLQYILGQTEFMGLPFEVDPRVLIPRPETEMLVERASEVIRSRGVRPRVLDIGTGSGCIAVALGIQFASAAIVAMDVSASALEVAAHNIRAHGLRNITLVRDDIMDDVFRGEEFDVIVANPPYISAAEFDLLEPEVRVFEPRIAATDGGDGLAFVRRIAGFASVHLVRGGTLVMEIGHGQAGEARSIATSAGLCGVSLHDDYARIPRVLIAGRAVDA